MSRFTIARILNLLIPGIGLIILGRLWLGLALAVWFTLGTEVAACGYLIAPASIPEPFTVIGVMLALAGWLLGQGLLEQRIRFLQDPNLPNELAILRQHADEALQRQDHKAARSILMVAQSIDDSDLPTQILWARLLTETANRGRARRAWASAARLDANREFREEIKRALGKLKKA